MQSPNRQPGSHLRVHTYITGTLQQVKQHFSSATYDRLTKHRIGRSNGFLPILVQ